MNNLISRDFKLTWVSQEGEQCEASVMATDHNEAKRLCAIAYPSFIRHYGGYTVRLMQHRKCTECGKDIHDAGRAKVCKGKLVDGVLVKSECYNEKWRRQKKEYPQKRVENHNPVFALKQKRLEVSKILPCLKCSQKFRSLHTYNRICPYCTMENAREARTEHKCYTSGKTINK